MSFNDNPYRGYNTQQTRLFPNLSDMKWSLIIEKMGGVLFNHRCFIYLTYVLFTLAILSPNNNQKQKNGLLLFVVIQTQYYRN